MKKEYIAILFILALLFCVFTYADTDKTESEFFGANSFIDGKDVVLFDKVLTKNAMTDFKINVKESDANIDYSVYTDGSGRYFIESSDNFGFTLQTDGKCDDTALPYGIIDMLTDTAKWQENYTDFLDGFSDILRSSAKSDDYSVTSSYVKLGTVRKKCRTITLNLSNDAELAKKFRDYFSSDAFVGLISNVFGIEYSSESLAKYVGTILPEDKLSLIYKRSIVSDSAIEEIATVSTSDNIYSMSVSCDDSDGMYNGELTVSDMNKTLDLKLNYTKNDTKNELVMSFNGVETKISNRDNNAYITIKDGNRTTSCIVSANEGYTPKTELYNMNIPSEKRSVFVKLGEWLKGNADAALLFRTYEVDLKPVEIDIQKYMINFEE